MGGKTLMTTTEDGPHARRGVGHEGQGARRKQDHTVLRLSAVQTSAAHPYSASFTRITNTGK